MHLLLAFKHSQTQNKKPPHERRAGNLWIALKGIHTHFEPPSHLITVDLQLKTAYFVLSFFVFAAHKTKVDLGD